MRKQKRHIIELPEYSKVGFYPLESLDKIFEKNKKDVGGMNTYAVVFIIMALLLQLLERLSLGSTSRWQ